MKNNKLYSKVFLWLFIGLLITFCSGYILYEIPPLALTLVSVGALPILIIELVIAFVFSFFIHKINVFVARICYLLFSLITGITFSTIFLNYQLSSLLAIFLLASVIFAILAFFGYRTKKDLTKMGTILLITLIVSLVGSFLNYLFFHNNISEIIFSVIGTFVFMGFIAYDMKVIQSLAKEMDEEKVAIFGAFTLYLDFINLLVRLIQYFGKEKD